MPHFAKAALQSSLPARGIDYLHMPELGGLRKPRPESINTGWRNVGFRGYADYMQTDDFWRALERLRELGAAKRTAVMCAEAVPWRCHRSLIADALTVAGEEVRHITGKGEPARHTLTPFARVERRSGASADHPSGASADNDRITYPPPDTLGL